MNGIIEYREKPLTEDQFRKLDVLAAKAINIKPKYVSKSVPVKDNDGNVYRWESDLVQCGYEVRVVSDYNETLMSSLRRPATIDAIVAHLTRLSVHKAFTQGDQGFNIILKDACRFLENFSEYAIAKVCDNFILDRSSRFFPQTAEIVDQSKSIHDQLLHIETPREAADTAAYKKNEAYVKTQKSKIRISRLTKLAIKPREQWSAWETRFFEGARK